VSEENLHDAEPPTVALPDYIFRASAE